MNTDVNRRPPGRVISDAAITALSIGATLICFFLFADLVSGTPRRPAKAQLTRVLAILCCFCLIILGGCLAFSRWAGRHETVALLDVTHDHAVSLEITAKVTLQTRAILASISIRFLHAASL